MNENITLTIRLFGAFRKYHATPLVLTLPSGISVGEIKNAVATELTALNSSFQDTELMNKSALANESRVLDLNTTLTENAQLAILPPVCGG